MSAHHLRRLAPVSLVAVVLVLAACSSSGSGHKAAHLSVSKTFPNAKALATTLHAHKVACGTPTTVTKLPAGVASEVSCNKTHYGVLDLVVFSGTTIPEAWTASLHARCGSSAATHYVHGKNWAIIGADTAAGNGGIDRLAQRVKLAARSFCS